MDGKILEQTPVAEADYWESLAEDAAAGNNEFAEATLANLERQLPKGYETDDEGRVIRLDPTLPDYVVIAPLNRTRPAPLAHGTVRPQGEDTGSRRPHYMISAMAANPFSSLHQTPLAGPASATIG